MFAPMVRYRRMRAANPAHRVIDAPRRAKVSEMGSHAQSGACQSWSGPAGFGRRLRRPSLRLREVRYVKSRARRGRSYRSNDVRAICKVDEDVPRLGDVREPRRRQPWTRIAYRDKDTVRLYCTRADQQLARSLPDLAHRFNGVHNQVQDRL